MKNEILNANVNVNANANANANTNADTSSTNNMSVADLLILNAYENQTKKNYQKKEYNYILFSNNLFDQPTNDGEQTCYQNSYAAYSRLRNTIAKKCKKDDDIAENLSTGWHDYKTASGNIVKYYFNRDTFIQWNQWRILLYRNKIKYFDGIAENNQNKVIAKLNQNDLDFKECIITIKDGKVFFEKIPRNKKSADFSKIKTNYKESGENE